MELIAALATAPGVSALGMVRLGGDGVPAAAAKFLRRRGGGGFLPRRAAVADALAGGEILDEVVVTYFPGPATATGEDLLEITAHGSPLILSRLLEAAVSAGARLAAPGEFTQRAFLTGRLDLAQAEAVGDLIRARTDGARRRALCQLQGGLSDRVARIRGPLLDLLVRLEAGLDHPEEDLSPLPREQAAREMAALGAAARRLADTHRGGRLLNEGARLAIVGRPNAGKSSLLNALLGRDRAIVCETPGTTRDTIEEPWEVGGAPALLIDTAGLRETPADPAEEAGMVRSFRALEGADLALLVIDGSSQAEPEEAAVHGRIEESAARLGMPLIRVLNKSDLESRRPQPPQGFRRDQSPLAVSAATGAGLDLLQEEIRRGLGLECADNEAVLVGSLRHVSALLDAAVALGTAEAAASGALDPLLPWEDRAASSLREAFRRLGEIIGEGAPDEVLRGIFSRFCIGK